MYQSKGQPTLLSCRSLVPQPSRRPAEPTHAHERTSECTQKGYSRRRVQYQRLSFRARAGEGSIPPSSGKKQATPHCRLTNALPSDGSSPKLTARLQKALPCGRFNAAIEQKKGGGEFVFCLYFEKCMFDSVFTKVRWWFKFNRKVDRPSQRHPPRSRVCSVAARTLFLHAWRCATLRALEPAVLPT